MPMKTGKYPIPKSTNSERLEILRLYSDDIVSDMIKYSYYKPLFNQLSERFETVEKWIQELKKEVENE